MSRSPWLECMEFHTGDVGMHVCRCEPRSNSITASCYSHVLRARSLRGGDRIAHNSISDTTAPRGPVVRRAPIRGIMDSSEVGLEVRRKRVAINEIRKDVKVVTMLKM